MRTGVTERAALPDLLPARFELRLDERERPPSPGREREEPEEVASYGRLMNETSQG